MVKRLLTLILFIGFAYAATAQTDLSFEAYSDAKQVVLRSYFQVNFSLKNGPAQGFTPPSFSDFTVISGPSRTASTMISNGQATSETRYTYSLQPRRVGKFTIGAATIKSGGKTLRSNPVEIEVVKGNSAAVSSDAEEVYIKAEPTVTEAWVGQQIGLDYRLYTAIQIDNYNILQESEYQGFYAQDVRQHDSRWLKEVINGNQYATKVLKRVALFPQQAGVLTVNPLNVQLGVVVGDDNRRNSFFFNKQIKRIPAVTEPVQIKVNPLPPDAPASFTGAVGQFNMQVGVGQNTITTDDALSLRMVISGNGDIKRVQVPKIDFPETFEVYDPKVVEESSSELNWQINGRKVIEYLAVPKEPGTFQIRPTLTYFDPDSAKYVVLQSQQPFSITVRQGSNRSKLPKVEGEEQVADKDIRFIKTDPGLKRPPFSFFGSTIFWILAGFPFLTLAGVLIIRRTQNKLLNIDPALTKSKKARKVAQQRLSTAENHLQANDSRAFYDEISKALLGYVCDKLHIPLSELTKDNVRIKLQSLSVPSDQIDRFMHIIQTSEMALFAGMDNASAMAETYEQSVSTLSDIEVFLKD
ncbi:MAG: hypothetical protein DHS20C18_20980 [Saprospiraceae bacterium]|nr:MAG: hypothetical protein DHS20C18_20980 [Saprospiraceae bacterium]